MMRFLAICSVWTVEELERVIIARQDHPDGRMVLAHIEDGYVFIGLEGEQTLRRYRLVVE